jgi:clan AA aspartic protease (TIGR02281 family)
MVYTKTKDRIMTPQARVALVFFAIQCVCACCFLTGSSADTVYLKNGRSLEGFVRSQDNESVELEVCSGAIKLNKSEIERVERSDPGEAALLRQKWDMQKVQTRQRIAEQKKLDAQRPKEVEFSGGTQGIMLDVELNNKAEVRLVLDTGASIVMLKRKTAKDLGMDLDRVIPDMFVQVADGRQVKAKHIVLNSVKTQGVEARNVDAAIMLEELGNTSFGDGLLGMSFLRQFNFKVDYKNKRLILERL